MMDTFLQDIRYGLRMLRKAPGFTLVVVLTLALGIGANTAIFSVVYAVLLRPMPFPRADRLISVFETCPSKGITHYTASPPDFFDWRDQNRVFASIAAYLRSPKALTDRGEAARIRTVSASPALFTVLGVRPLLGRTPREDEAQKGREHVVVLSHALWQSRFGGDRNVIGQTARLDGESYEVIGVMPAGFQFPLSGSDAWVPLSLGDVSSQRGAHYLSVLARLKDGVAVEQSRSEMQTIGDRLAAAYPKTNEGWSASANAYHDAVVGKVRPALLILLAAVGLVVLIACTNVANLLLARANERSREVAVRTALGAAPWRLIRQLLTESLLLGLLGGVAGLLVAAWGIAGIVRFGPKDIPRLESLALNGEVLVFCFGLSLLTGLIFGIIPAIRASRSDLNQALKAGARSVGDHRRDWVRGWLVTGELALSLVLLTGAVLLLRSFGRLTQVDPGFNATNLLVFNLSLPEAAYPDGNRVAQFSDALLRNLQALPNVEVAGTIFPQPMSGNEFSSTFSVKGAPPEEQGLDVGRSVEVRVASRDYFRAMQIPLLRGRGFGDTDRRDSPHVLVLSQHAAQRFFAKDDPIGKEMKIDARPGYDKLSGEIIGVVGDVHDFGLDVAPPPDVYALSDQGGVGDFNVMLRTRGDPMALANAVRSEVHSLDQNVPVADMSTMDDVLGQTLGERRFYMLLLGLFAAVALALAAVGVYGVIAYSVSRRTQEIGVRLALGARPGQVLWMVFSQSARLAALGIAGGLIATMLATRLLSGLLFGITAQDPVSLVGATLGLAGIALLSGLHPARRATRVDPMVALRYE